MLKNTLILPTDDDAQAAQLLRDAINDLDVIVMLVFGTGITTEQIVMWADQLCNKANVGAVTIRRVVWVKTIGNAVGQLVLATIGGTLPAVAVLGFHDDVKASLAADDRIDPIELEKAFLQGGTL